ncbi:TonB-dependent receptor [uncultured Parasphingorhabdus sp.]|uniref:TonB-dependent receptor n=1 Tax=uncultured Parasphingorhabdus sp. TaxID=2709694 RepID=UPI0030DD1F40
MLNWKSKRTLLAGMVMANFAVTTEGAYAQAIGPESEAGPRLEEIIVTAQRRSQNVQDIPVTVSALSSDLLEQRQISNTIDLSRSVPNLVSANNVLLGTSVTYFLRGTGSTESISTFDLPVGTYIDEVYIARQNANQIALSGVERVEVLRGPQGALFGRNTTAGAVSIISKKPTNEFGFEGELTYGSFNRRSFNGALNAPVTDGLMLRVSAFGVEDDGYLKSPLTENLNGETSWGGRIALRALPNDIITWDISAQYINSEKTGLGVPGIVQDGPGGPFTVFPIPATGDLLTGLYEAGACEPQGAIQTWAAQNCLYSGVESTLLISNIGIETGIGNFSIISGYSRINQKFNLDNFANTNQPVLGGGFGSNFYLSNLGTHEQFTQEVKLSGETLNGDLDYVVGIFYLDESNNTTVIDTVDFADEIPVVFADRIIDNGTSSFAVYGQIDYTIIPDLRLQLGGRFTSEKKDFAVNGQFFGAPVVTSDLAVAGIPLELNVNRFTPRVALQYEIDPATLVFASYTEGFKSGGWNARAFAPGGFVAFTPEYVKSIELGLKTDFWDGRGRLNATLFRAEYSDLQVPGILPGSTDFITLNAADSLVQGLELEGSVRIVEDLTIFSNVGLTDAKYKELSAAAIAASLGPKLQRTPDVTAQVGLVGSVYIANEHKLTLAADAQYTSSYETGPSNTLAGSVGGQTTVNAQLSWTPPSEKWELSFGCKNCTNNVYVVQELLGQIFANDPRRFTVTARFNY